MINDNVRRILTNAKTITLVTPEADLEIPLTTEELLSDLYYAITFDSQKTAENTIAVERERINRLDLSVSSLSTALIAKVEEMNAILARLKAKEEAIQLALRTCLMCSTSPGHKATALMQAMYDFPYAKTVLGSNTITTDYSQDFIFLATHMKEDYAAQVQALEEKKNTLKVVNIQKEALKNATLTNVLQESLSKVRSTIETFQLWTPQIPDSSTRGFFSIIIQIRENYAKLQELYKTFQSLNPRERHEGEMDGDQQELLNSADELDAQLQQFGSMVTSMTTFGHKALEADNMFAAKSDTITRFRQPVENAIASLSELNERYARISTEYTEEKSKLREFHESILSTYEEVVRLKSEWDAYWDNLFSRINNEVSRIKGEPVTGTEGWDYWDRRQESDRAPKDLPIRLTYAQLRGIFPDIRTNSKSYILAHSSEVTYNGKIYKVFDNQLMSTVDHEDLITDWAAGWPALVRSEIGSNARIWFTLNTTNQHKAWVLGRVSGSQPSDFRVISYVSGTINNVRTFSFRSASYFASGIREAINAFFGSTASEWIVINEVY